MTSQASTSVAYSSRKSALWIMIPALSTEWLEVTLEGVEEGGIWIQNQSVTDILLRAMDKPSLEGTPVVFVPYSGIRYAITLAEGMSLSTEKLGL